MKRFRRNKQPRVPLAYESPMDSEILEAYLHKNSHYNQADARRIRRTLRKLAFSH